MSDGLAGVPCVIQLETIMGAAQMSAAIVRLRLTFGNHRPWGPRRKLPAIWVEKMHFCDESNFAMAPSRASLGASGFWAGRFVRRWAKARLWSPGSGVRNQILSWLWRMFKLESSSWPENVSRQEGADAGRYHHTKRVRPPCRASTPASLSLSPDWHSIRASEGSLDLSADNDGLPYPIGQQSALLLDSKIATQNAPSPTPNCAASNMAQKVSYTPHAALSQPRGSSKRGWVVGVPVMPLCPLRETPG